jgi:hypothetical protein
MPISASRHFRRGFDPNQPRVPAGNSDGGQWTRMGGDAARYREVIRDWTGMQPWAAVVNNYQNDGSIFQQAVVNRDGSTIRSEFSRESAADGWNEQHSVVLPGGHAVVFDNGLINEIHNGREAEATVQQAYLAPPAPHPLTMALAAAATLYTWLSTGNGADGQAVLAYPATVYHPDERNLLGRTWVGRLSENELSGVCPRLPQVQEFTDQAASSVNRLSYSTPKTYGTAVHTLLRHDIEALGHPNLRAEVSLLKTLQETGEMSRPLADQETYYGRRGSIRIDVLEYVGNGTVCVYDIKTGSTGLIPGRISEIARTVYLRFPMALRIVVTEMRPRR